MLEKKQQLMEQLEIKKTEHKKQYRELEKILEDVVNEKQNHLERNKLLAALCAKKNNKHIVNQQKETQEVERTFEITNQLQKHLDEMKTKSKKEEEKLKKRLEYVLKDNQKHLDKEKKIRRSDQECK